MTTTEAKDGAGATAGATAGTVKTVIRPQVWEISIDQIEKRASGHFFDPGAAWFFRTRYPQTGFEGFGGVFFVTSEQFNARSPRLFTVRQLFPSGDVRTVGQFQGYGTRDAAKRAARRFAADGPPATPAA